MQAPQETCDECGLPSDQCLCEKKDTEDLDANGFNSGVEEEEAV